MLFCCILSPSLSLCPSLSFSVCVTNPNAGSHHCWEWSPSVRMLFCRSSETAFSFSVLSDFCSVSPVAAHPFCEVAILILFVIHDESRQEPEGHGKNVKGASLCSKSQKFGCIRATQRMRTMLGDPLSLWLTDSSTLLDKESWFKFDSSEAFHSILRWSQNKWKRILL